MRIGSLFTGYNGLDMAVQEVLGGELAWVADPAPGPSKLLAHRYPNVPNLGDITTVDWATVPPVDIITGGSPCQDLSTAGRRAGMTDGTRSNLWVVMREAIAHVRPKLVVWENVRGALSAVAASAVESEPGLLGDRGGRPALRALGRVVGDLADLGYVGRWVGLRVADLGGCHGRFRIFLVAWPADTPDADRIRIDRTGHAWDGGPGSPDSSSTADPLSLLPTPRVTQAGYANDGRGGKSLDVEARRGQWGSYAQAIASHERLAGRPAPSPTEPGSNDKPRLSARFVEWMMCLPDGWVTDVPGVTRNEQLALLGNGVCPPQAAAALNHLLGRPSGRPFPS